MTLNLLNRAQKSILLLQDMQKYTGTITECYILYILPNLSLCDFGFQGLVRSYFKDVPTFQNTMQLLYQDEHEYKKKVYINKSINTNVNTWTSILALWWGCIIQWKWVVWQRRKVGGKSCRQTFSICSHFMVGIVGICILIGSLLMDP